MKGEVWDLMRRQSEAWWQSMIGVMMQFEASGTGMQALPTARSWDPMQSGLRAFNSSSRRYPKRCWSRLHACMPMIMAF